MYNKTAKDLAFDRERAKYGRQIKDLENKLKQKNNENLELQTQVKKLESKCDSLQEWVDRLLEYANMSEEDMKTIIQKDKDSAEAMHMMTGLLRVAQGFGSYSY